MASVPRLPSIMFFTYLLATLVCAQRPIRPPVPPVPAVPYVGHLDESQAFDAILALVGGGGVFPASRGLAAQYGGLKFGGACCVRGTHPDEHADTVTLDVGWDRLRGRSAFNFEMSLMVPMLRIPGPIRNQSRRFLRVYAEPGAGFRVGGGTFAYYSAKAMIAFMSDQQIAIGNGGPIVEIQRRFPWNSIAHGDTRVLVGVMYEICRHCGL